MRIVITGSRSWTDENLIQETLAKLPLWAVIVHGLCPKGADEIADRQARLLGLGVERYPADWQRYHRLGKKNPAGVIRNQEMLDSNPELVIAFWDGQSPGTKHCIQEARKRGIPVEIVLDPRFVDRAIERITG